MLRIGSNKKLLSGDGIVTMSVVELWDNRDVNLEDFGFLVDENMGISP